MKKLLISGLIVMLGITFSCEKLKDPAGARNPAGVPSITNVNPAIFDSKDLVNSYVQFTLNTQDGFPADKVAILASYNSDGNWVDVTDLTTFPSTVRLISGNVIQQLGLSPASIQNGDIFTFQAKVTENGKSFLTNSVLDIPVACAYNVALATGSYHSVSPPDQWNSDGIVTLTADVNNPYKISLTGIEALEGQTEIAPLVMNIDPLSYKVTVPKKVIVAVAFGSYHNLAYEGTGTYSSCDGSYQMSFNISVDEGNFGTFAFTFTRNP